MACTTTMSDGNEILEGTLACKRCEREYSIQDGIANLMPQSRVTQQPHYEDEGVISTYLWSHYADVMGDFDAVSAYEEWGDLLLDPGRQCLDAGCAAGRITFEMSATADFVVGIDCSEAFIRWARRLLDSDATTFSMITEGELTELKTIVLPRHWRRERVEFIVADALAIPFPNSFFSTTASINLLDKIADPLGHVIEVDRVTRNEDAHLFISDPFSWSEDYTPQLQWLGGKTSGRFSGAGVRNLGTLLIGKNQMIQPPWLIRDQGDVWWKIRNTINHFELIRSHYISAVR